MEPYILTFHQWLNMEYGLVKRQYKEMTDLQKGIYQRKYKEYVDGFHALVETKSCLECHQTLNNCGMCLSLKGIVKFTESYICSLEEAIDGFWDSMKCSLSPAYTEEQIKEWLRTAAKEVLELHGYMKGEK